MRVLYYKESPADLYDQLGFLKFYEVFLKTPNIMRKKVGGALVISMKRRNFA